MPEELPESEYLYADRFNIILTNTLVQDEEYCDGGSAYFIIHLKVEDTQSNKCFTEEGIDTITTILEANFTENISIYDIRNFGRTYCDLITYSETS